MIASHTKAPHQFQPLTRAPFLKHLWRTPPPPRPLIRIPPPPPPKQKVVVLMGATGTGKSRLAVDLALHFNGEVINSDKIQMHAGLNIVTNKVTAEECKGVPHHLLGVVEPDDDFSASDFRREASLAAGMISRHGSLPIVAGGSNSYVEELVDGAGRAFRKQFECCFLWIDVRLPVLHSFVSERVDRMVQRGLIEEVKDLFNPYVDYKKGIRRAIGLPELDQYLRSEGLVSDTQRSKLLKDAIKAVKANTCSLTSQQLAKIHQLCILPGWNVHRIDATDIFQKKGKDFDMAWSSLVKGPTVGIVRKFLYRGREHHGMKNYKTRKSIVNKTAAPEGSMNISRYKQASVGTPVSVGATVYS